MLKFFGEPNLVVNAMIKGINGRPKMIHLFKFDENGEVIVDETKMSPFAISKAKQRFKVERIPTEVEKEIVDMDELIALAKTLGIRSPHLMKMNNLITKIALKMSEEKEKEV